MNPRRFLAFLVVCSALLFAGPVHASSIGEIICDLSKVACPGGLSVGGVGSVTGLQTGPLASSVSATIDEQFNPTTLPFFAFTGDVVLLNSDGSVSDIVNFVGPANSFTHTVFMYSNCDEGPCEPWDVAVPPGYILSANAVIGPEFGADPPAGAIYTILNPDGSINAQYNIISDAVVVPEPSSLMLLGTGLVGLAGMFRRKLSQ